MGSIFLGQTYHGNKSYPTNIKNVKAHICLYVCKSITTTIFADYANIWSAAGNEPLASQPANCPSHHVGHQNKDILQSFINLSTRVNKNKLEPKCKAQTYPRPP